MFSFFNESKPASVIEVTGGVAIGIFVTYIMTYAPEIFSGAHSIDFSYLSNLLLLGIPVIIYGWFQSEKVRQRAR
ncbi:hypothetical protein [Neolewinella agarilytica]|uniref:hypothetical protein n=1 Tax=Neolewinella agarilytica TaxID=478744 RepID=UPI0023578C8E|nr:hypothetical protein [Neolewinella agarilytica]